MALLYVALGGAVGAVARYGLTGFVYQRFSDAFPWGTVTVNVVVLWPWASPSYTSRTVSRRRSCAGP